MTAKNTEPSDVVLASGSRYRRKLLSELGIPVISDPANIDEQELEGESAAALALRLAIAKARAVAPRHAGALVIGSDQVGELDGRKLGKPGSVEKAEDQLLAASGREVCFYTGLCLINTRTGSEHSLVDEYRVRFRALSRQQVRRYVELEQPLDCAGSFKVEGLGIALFESLSGKDPNTLIGLPVIELISLLHSEGYSLL